MLYLCCDILFYYRIVVSDLYNYRDLHWIGAGRPVNELPTEKKTQWSCGNFRTCSVNLREGGGNRSVVPHTPKIGPNTNRGRTKIGLNPYRGVVKVRPNRNRGAVKIRPNTDCGVPKIRSTADFGTNALKKMGKNVHIFIQRHVKLLLFLY